MYLHNLSDRKSNRLVITVSQGAEAAVGLMPLQRSPVSLSKEAGFLPRSQEEWVEGLLTMPVVERWDKLKAEFPRRFCL